MTERAIILMIRQENERPYYIKFLKHDKRFDCWVEASSLQRFVLVESTDTNKKITRK